MTRFAAAAVRAWVEQTSRACGKPAVLDDDDVAELVAGILLAAPRSPRRRAVKPRADGDLSERAARET